MPEEVYQHLEHLSTSSTPLLVSGEGVEGGGGAGELVGGRGELVGGRGRGGSGRGKERSYWQKNERKAVNKNEGIESRPPSSPPRLPSL